MSESDINFKALKKLDPYIQRIDVSCSNVALYNFNTQDTQWERTEVEGTLFLFEREAEPKYGFTIMNRLNPENHIEPVTGKLDFQIQPPFLLYKNSDGEIRGLWFYSGSECQKVGNRIQQLVKEVEREQEAKRSKKQAMGSGESGGNLTALFQKADKAMKREEAMKQQHSGHVNMSSSSSHTVNSSSTDSGKNLLRLLSQPENNNNNNVAKPQQTSKGETTESVNAFFAMASNNQQLRVTPQPVLNGAMPGAGVACSTVESSMMPQEAGGETWEDPCEGLSCLPPAAMAPLPLHQPAVFGMPGVIQALPISQGLAMGAVPVAGFTPYPGSSGLVAAAPSGGGSGLTVTPAAVGGQQQQLLTGAAQMQNLLSKQSGAMTVDKLEEEQRKSLSPRNRDLVQQPHSPGSRDQLQGGKENLGDLSSKLKEQLGVKMTAALQKPVTQPAVVQQRAAKTQHQPQKPPPVLPQISGLTAAEKNGPVLLSPHMFSASSPLLETSNSTLQQQHSPLLDQQHRLGDQSPRDSRKLAEAGRHHTNKEGRSDKEVTPLTKDQLIEAMEFLLKTDDSFVEKLHLAYVQSLQQRLK